MSQWVVVNGRHALVPEAAAAHPYRESAAPLAGEPIYCVITEPSEFRCDESRLRGPYTAVQARDVAYRFAAKHPCGEARVRQVKAWPPEIAQMNWTYVPRPDDGSLEV